ncbi:hypothetical protein V5799_028741 [Amblyomma americanum]|uniref:Uncharacterized protein n=1 Tax=Amblyomma americanum TaxID=6943 RepID=A0AAQ4DC02_AMBAM
MHGSGGCRHFKPTPRTNSSGRQRRRKLPAPLRWRLSIRCFTPVQQSETMRFLGNGQGTPAGPPSATASELRET